jgi:hypothetical protein
MYLPYRNPGFILSFTTFAPTDARSSTSLSLPQAFFPSLHFALFALFVRVQKKNGERERVCERACVCVCVCVMRVCVCESSVSLPLVKRYELDGEKREIEAERERETKREKGRTWVHSLTFISEEPVRFCLVYGSMLCLFATLLACLLSLSLSLPLSHSAPFRASLYSPQFQSSPWMHCQSFLRASPVSPLLS